MNPDNVPFAFALTSLAGLATGVGGLLTLMARKTNTRLLSLSLGFSAGVMIYVSFVEILSKANESLAAAQGSTWGGWLTVLGFFGGMAMIAVIDRLVPSMGNPHEIHQAEELRSTDRPASGKLMRLGLLSALAIAIHNFPEGMATFAAALKDPALGLSIAVAIAMHNLPEGMAVAVPIYYATGSRAKALGYALLSGLAEPFGALVAYLVLRPFFTETLFGLIFAGVAGIMVFISFDQLLPSAEEYGEHHLAVYGLVAGMAVMALSLLLL